MNAAISLWCKRLNDVGTQPIDGGEARVVMEKFDARKRPKDFHLRQRVERSGHAVARRVTRRDERANDPCDREVQGGPAHSDRPDGGQVFLGKAVSVQVAGHASNKRASPKPSQVCILAKSPSGLVTGGDALLRVTTGSRFVGRPAEYNTFGEYAGRAFPVVARD